MTWLDEMMKSGNQPGKELTAYQLKWGEAQLKQMLEDRPAMKPYVHEGDDLWTWTVRQFAGEISQVEVQWDDQKYGPDAGDARDRDAGTTFWPPSDKIHITVAKNYGSVGNLKDRALLKGKPIDGPTLWYYAIFEIFNSQKMYRFMKVCRRALEGKIDRETFILEVDMVENGTRKDALDFYQNVFVHHCQKYLLSIKGSVVANELSQVTDVQKQFYPEDRIDELITGKESIDHYRSYGQVYDSLIFPYLSKK